MFRFVWFQSWIFTLKGGPFVLLPMDFQGCRFRCWDEFDPLSPYPMEWEKRWPRQRNWNKWVSSGVCVCVLRNMFQQTIPVSINLKNLQQTHKTQIINWTHTTWTNRNNLGWYLSGIRMPIKSAKHVIWICVACGILKKKTRAAWFFKVA